MVTLEIKLFLHFGPSTEIDLHAATSIRLLFRQRDPAN